GPPVPRRDRDTDSERYARLMLVLFKPWRLPTDLCGDGGNWSTCYEQYLPHMSEENIEVMNNLQLLHECKDSRDD
ncbi:hypothetical protein FKP32DRAFT_1541803, partial [Trametes sanguinea]